MSRFWKPLPVVALLFFTPRPLLIPSFYAWPIRVNKAPVRIDNRVSTSVNHGEPQPIELTVEDDTVPSAHLRKALASRSLQPVCLASGDFNEDGVPDLAHGYETPDGSFLSWHPGTIDTLWPQGSTARRHRQEGSFSEVPFLSPTAVLSIPVRPDYLEAADFNRDGHVDLVIGSRQAGEIYFLAGRGAFAFAEMQPIGLPGPLTSMLGEELSRGGMPRIVVSVSTAAGPSLQSYQWDRNLGWRNSEIAKLPEPAAWLASGHLDEELSADLVVGMPGEILILHLGREGNQRTDSRPMVSPLSSLSVGRFLARHEEQIAAFSAAGTLEILTLTDGQLEPLVSAEIELAPEPTSAPWQGSRHGPQLQVARVSLSEGADLVLVVNGRLRILSFRSYSEVSPSGAEYLVRSYSPQLLDPAQVATVLPMRLNRDALDDLVIASGGDNPLAVLPTQAGHTFIVNEVGDEGDADLNDDGQDCDINEETPEFECTFRAALSQANVTEGSDEIFFEVSMLKPGLPPEGSNAPKFLPAVSGVTIDGRVLVNGEFSEDRLFLDGADYPSGSFAETVGLRLGSDCVVRNMIIGNFRGGGISISGPGNFIEGNIIGTDAGYSARLGSLRYGIHVRGPGNTVGGTVPEAANVVANYSSFSAVGIFLDGNSGEATTGNLVQGNFIGTDPSGSVNLRNKTGIAILGASGNQIGVLTDAGGNLIRNNETGVRVGNQAALVSTSNRILGNEISSNSLGVTIHDGMGNSISHNSISENTSLGIDLGTCGLSADPHCGVTPNDVGDPDAEPPQLPDEDTGPNGLQNYPVLTLTPGTSDVELTLSSTPDTLFTIEVFSNDRCHPTGYGEGQSPLDSFSLQTVFDGTALAFLKGLPEGKFITATATDPAGNTSEFSKCAEVPSQEFFLVNSTDDDPDLDSIAGQPAGESSFDGVCSTGSKADGSEGQCDPVTVGDCECTLRAAIQEANATEDKDLILFEFEPGTIFLTGSLPTVTRPVIIDGEQNVLLSGLGGDPDVSFDGLTVETDYCEIRGLGFTFFQNGILIRSGSLNKIQGNGFGFNQVGISSKAGNLIGGPSSGPGCDFPCNRFEQNDTAIIVEDDNTVQGNLISAKKAEGSVGIEMSGSDNLIGGTEEGAGNLITKKETAVRVSGGSHNRIQGNLIGTSDGVADEGNKSGINVIALAEPVVDLLIGGLAPGAGNVIAFNDTSINVEGLVPNLTFLSNSLFANQTVFSYHPFGGAAILEAAPELRFAALEPGQGQNILRLSGIATGRPIHTLTVQLFSNPECEKPQGRTLLATLQEPANVGGKLYFSESIGTAGLEAGHFLTATVTDLASPWTSAFSLCRKIEVDMDGDGVPVSTDPDDQDPQVIAIPSVGGGQIDIRTDEAELIAFIQIVGSLGGPVSELPMSLEGDDQVLPAELVEVLLILTEDSNPTASPLQAGSATLTMTLPPGMEIDTYFNYGPTPDDPQDHYYEFLFDGSTGAEIFEDRIVVHFVDGQRGDHDLTVNGEILTRGGPATRATIFYFPQLGDGAVADIRFQSSVVLNNTGGISPVQIQLFDSGGSPLELDFSDLGQDSRFEFGLGAGQSFSSQTPGTEEIQVGYGEVIGASGLGGTAVFSRSDLDSEILLYEAGVPASMPLTDFTLFVDTTGPRDTGLALAYPLRGSGGAPAQAADANLTLRLYDGQFQLLASEVLSMAPGTHLARFIPQLFPDQAGQFGDLQGSVTVQSDQPVVAVTLRQSDDPARSFPEEVPTLTTLPVLPGRADSAGPAQGEEQTFYFPQVGDGTVADIQFQTSLIFVNTGEASLVRVEFFDSHGDPMELDLGEGPPAASYQWNLASGAALSLQTPGTDNLKVGYARIRAGAGVGGTAVFSRSDADQGTLLYESGVPASSALAEFSLVVDTLGNRDTGLALVNPPVGDTAPAQTAEVSLRLYDAGFNLVAENSLEIGPGEHLARFIAQLFPDVSETLTEMSGSLQVSSSVPLAALTLRQNDNPVLSFPLDVPTLTTFPVLAGREGAGSQEP